MLFPKVVITTALDDRSRELLVSFGYTHHLTIPETNTPSYMLYKIASPEFNVFVKTGEDNSSTLPEGTVPLTDQMLMLADCLSMSDDEKHVLTVFGTICSDFSAASDALLFLDHDLIEDTIIAMMLNNRNATANQMFRYATENGVKMKYIKINGRENLGESPE